MENQKTVAITKDNYLDYQFFVTTRDLEFYDGSKIKTGTQFMIENHKNENEFKIHFCSDERNYYANGIGDGFEATLKQIQVFSKAYEDSKMLNNEQEEDYGYSEEEENYTQYLLDRYEKHTQKLYAENEYSRSYERSSVRGGLEDIKDKNLILKVYTQEYQKPFLLTYENEKVDMKMPNVASWHYKNKTFSFEDAVNKMNTYSIKKINVIENTKTLSRENVQSRQL